jgi:8-oxo-dGTP diphosphatase
VTTSGEHRLKRYVVLVGALVVYDDAVLLLQRSSQERFLPDLWGLPAGKIRYGESPEAAVLRELKEEAGIAGTVEGFAGTVWFRSKIHNEQIGNMQLNFLVRAKDRSVVLDGANQDHAWLPIDELPSAPMRLDEFTRKSIRTALNSFENENHYSLGS